MKSLAKSHVPKPDAKSRTPVFWPTSDRTTAIQTHTRQDGDCVKQKLQGKRIAYSCAGEPLEVYEVHKSVQFGTKWITDLLPEAKEVSGGVEVKRMTV